MKTNEIEQGNYQGYYWMSDETAPHLLNGEPFTLQLNNDTNPFVIEAQLYNDNGISYSIKYFDGNYLIHKYDTNQLAKQANTIVDTLIFNGHRMEGKALKFNRYWREVSDDLLCGLTTLEPKEFVFIGFTN